MTKNGKSLAQLILGGLLLSIGDASVAYSQQTSISQGLSFVGSAQNADGSWGGTPTSLNTVAQTTATTARTVQLLGVTGPNLSNAIDFLTAQTLNTVDDVARQLEALAASGAPVTALVLSLNAIQQANGGWGVDFSGTYSSAIVDTIAAVGALQTANGLNTSLVPAMLGYIASNQNTDGGWGIVKGRPSEIFYTAQALLVLKPFQQSFNINPSINAATQFLAARQNPNGSFGNSVFETALAFQALSRFGMSPSSRDSAIAYLLSTQLPNGSWADDAYSTALALRALNDALVVVQDQIQTISLFRVLTGGGLSPAVNFDAFETVAIVVTVADPSLLLEVFIRDTTGTDHLPRIGGGGEFLFDTINLPPGTFTVTVRALEPILKVVVDEETVTFGVDPTFSVSNFGLSLDPGFSHVGAAETINVVLSLNNRSNIPGSVTLEDEVRSPTGVLLNSQTSQYLISPNETSRNLVASSFAHSFTQSGNYPVQVDILEGANSLGTVSGAIGVAPAIRIDPTKSVNPQSVPPDPDKRIRIDIHLEGVEETP